MSEEIEVCFITSTSNINTASYRIWVKDLAVYLNEIGTKAYVNKLPNNIKPNIVIILGKSDIDKCNNYKKVSKQFNWNNKSTRWYFIQSRLYNYRIYRREGFISYE